MNVDYLTVCNVAGFDIRSYTAAVYECYVSAEKRTISVSTEVAEVGFTCADYSLSRFGVVYYEVDFGLCHNCFNKLVELYCDTVNKFLCGSVVFGNICVELEGLAVRCYCHFAESRELCSCGADVNLFSVLVCDSFAFDSAV